MNHGILTIPKITESQRPKWLAERRSGIGGSDIAAILGLSSWATELDVWLSKTTEMPEKPMTPQMAWGRRLERMVLERYGENHGLVLMETTEPLIYRHPTMPCAIGSPDALTAEVGVEAKTAGWYTMAKWGEPGSDDIPQNYLLQCIWYMAVTGKSSWDVAVLFGGSDYAEYRIHRDAELEASLLEKAAAWWQRHIIEGVEPVLDGSRSAADYIAWRFPRNVEKLKSADNAGNELLEMYALARENLAGAEAEESRYSTLLKEFIGDADGLDGLQYRATWKNTKDSQKTDWEAVAKASGVSAELIQKFTVTKPGARRFLWKERE